MGEGYYIQQIEEKNVYEIIKIGYFDSYKQLAIVDLRCESERGKTGTWKGHQMGDCSTRRTPIYGF